MRQYRMCLSIVIAALVVFFSAPPHGAASLKTRLLSRQQVKQQITQRAKQPARPTQNERWRVFYLDPQLGWKAGPKGVIMKTTDGGNNWIEQHSGLLQDFFAIRFTNRLSGQAVSARGVVINTDDGGTTWWRHKTGAASEPKIDAQTTISSGDLHAQNYPNPFNPTTTISFHLAQSSVVTLKIYNSLGQEVATLLNREQMSDGDQEARFNASNSASGVYFYRLEGLGLAGDRKSFTQVKKMLLLR